MNKQQTTTTNQNKKQPLLGAPTKGKGAGLAFSLSSMLATLLLLVVMVFLGIFGLAEEGFENTNWYLYLCYILPPVASALIVYYYLRYTKTPIKQAARSQKCHYKYFLLAIALQFGLLALSEVNTWFIDFLGKFGYVAKPVEIPSIEGAGFIGVFFVIAILVPIAEEALFRGVILDGLKSGFSALFAALVCGALFALYHQSPVQTIYQFCCGFAYALLAVKAGSVLPSMLAHFINNAYILILTKCGVTVIPNNVLIPLMIVSGICFVATLVYLLFFDKKDEKIVDKTEKKLEIKRFFALAAAGLVVCVFAWVSGLFA